LKWLIARDPRLPKVLVDPLQGKRVEAGFDPAPDGVIRRQSCGRIAA
jgi:hypothetical protein